MGPSRVSRPTLKMAGTALGFITTTHESWPRRVEPSGMSQVRPSEDAHGSDAIPDSAPPPRAAQDTPTQPPKYSTSDAVSLARARRRRWTSDIGGTEPIGAVLELRRVNVETRI